MKNTFKYISLLCLMFYGTTQGQTQHLSSSEHNYLVLSKNVQQLTPVLLTAQELAKEDKEKFGVFYMIICGKTVTDIPDNISFNKLLDQAESQNVKVFVCGISLKKFNIHPDQIPDNIEVISNGILYGFQLKKQGFITLTI